jgi:hypothetical protein
MPKRWYAFVLYKKIGDLEAALALWTDFYNTTENPAEKEIAKFYKNRTKMKLDIKFLDKKVEAFKEMFGRRAYNLTELVTYGLIDSIPAEPHGEQYFLKRGKVYSSKSIIDL